jgi:hypothetical protein
MPMTTECGPAAGADADSQRRRGVVDPSGQSRSGRSTGSGRYPLAEAHRQYWGDATRRLSDTTDLPDLYAVYTVLGLIEPLRAAVPVPEAPQLEDPYAGTGIVVISDATRR